MEDGQNRCGVDYSLVWTVRLLATVIPLDRPESLLQQRIMIRKLPDLLNSKANTECFFYYTARVS